MLKFYFQSNEKKKKKKKKEKKRKKEGKKKKRKKRITKSNFHFVHLREKNVFVFLLQTDKYEKRI